MAHMVETPRYRFYVDTDEPVTVTLEDIVTAWATRLPIDVARIRDLAVGERMLVNRFAPYVAVERIQ